MRVEKRNYNGFDLVRLPFKCAPIHTIIIGLSKILDGLVPTFKILATAWFVDTAISIVSTGEDFKRATMPIVVLVCLVGYEWISKKLINFVNVRLEIRIRETLRLATVDKRACLCYEHIENSDSWDLVSRVCREPEKTLKDAYLNVLALVSLIINITGFLIVLITQVWWAALLILVISVPLFTLSIKGGKASYEASREAEKFKRKSTYLEEVLTGRDGVEERTLFGFTKDINEKWEEQYEASRKMKLKVEAKYFIKMKGASIITSIITIFIMIVLIPPVASKTITVGMFISLVNAVISIIGMMSWQLSSMTTDLTTHIEYLKDLTSFSKLSEEEDAIDLPLKEVVNFKTLEFNNVKFKYPGTENYILDGMTFTIEHGKHYAFVGGNGAGKTTVTKLITGLYKNYEGDILIDGKNIKEYSQSYLKALCAVVYQDFAKYFIAFKDNISLGRINGLKTGTNDEIITSACHTMELSDVIEKLPNGIDTYLGKVKSGGVDLSGGQWQRVAMARTIINDAPLKILDEPTAALDPISESNIYMKFEEISRGGTTIFISHRLGSTKLADEIFVLGEGKVLEQGSHNELINKNGVYAEMYESQKGWYM